MPRLAVPESQMVWPVPLSRRRLPVGWNWNEALESRGVVPADQTGIPPEKTMEARSEGGEVGGLRGMKVREKVLFGEDQVWFVLEA